MTSEDARKRLVEEALSALLSMAPDRIELAEGALRDCRVTPGLVDCKETLQLRLARAAAIQAAQMWRGCIPQPGYGPAGPRAETETVSSLSVTG